jgi:hypothetical protein
VADAIAPTKLTESIYLTFKAKQKSEYLSSCCGYLLFNMNQSWAVFYPTFAFMMMASIFHFRTTVKVEVRSSIIVI